MTAPLPITCIVWSANTIAQVSSSTPTPRSDGDCATSASSRPIPAALLEVLVDHDPVQDAEPADNCTIRFFGVAPGWPKATMCDAIA